MDIFMEPYDCFDFQPLHAAVFKGFFRGARLLLEYGAPVNSEPREYVVPPLFLAPDTGSFPVFQLLLQHGADIYALYWYGNNFLHYCVGQAEAFGDKTFFPAYALQMLRAALEMGVDVHHDGRESSWGENGSDGYRPIRAAVKHRSYWAIPSLIEYGAAFVRPNDSYSLFLSAACCTCFESALLCAQHALLKTSSKQERTSTRRGAGP